MSSHVTEEAQIQHRKSTNHTTSRRIDLIQFRTEVIIYSSRSFKSFASQLQVTADGARKRTPFKAEAKRK
jgi:hypothetical protein